MIEPDPTTGEEIASTVIHGLGLVATIAAIPALAMAAARQGDPWRTVGAAVFGTTLTLLYATSTLYHALPAARLPRAKRLFRVLDHAAIFLLIAGTYTPFMLGPLRGPWGWALFGTIWGLAVFGVTLKTTVGFRFPQASTALYLLMGWLVLVAIRPLVARLDRTALAWLVAGGACYTAGVVFFAWERLRYGHAVWHLFVTAGSACHYFAVLAGVLSARGW
ncbi:MAG: hemolysin III family protein [candidate division NC10 bacterium]|nr:hemolysin III family protein [candidate division NC10 bacterium]